ncbi:MAG TPA: CDP-alcohol phosphatidyltransferase family protein [Jatrophihabitantaceae bacterium]|nr:CDP-alcohol phosphatidyltransferase family protein [Jatrophihabitantaceae bacterium]
MAVDRYRETTDSQPDSPNGFLDTVLNIHARGFFGNLVRPLATRLVRAGVTPDAITIVGTVGATASAVVFFTRGAWFTGTMLVWGFVMLDLVDGAVARIGGRSTKFGAVLDSSCDRIADAAVFGSIGWYFAMHGQRWMFLACLLCLVLGSLTSYIRARAEAAGLTATVGIAERADRLIIVLVGTGLSGEHLRVPFLQAIALWALVAASTVTVLQRFTTVYRQSKAAEMTRAEAP